MKWLIQLFFAIKLFESHGTQHLIKNIFLQNLLHSVYFYLAICYWKNSGFGLMIVVDRARVIENSPVVIHVLDTY